MWFSWIWYTYRDGYYQNDLNRSVSFYWTPTYWVAFTVFYTLTTTGSSRDCMVKYWATFVQVAGNQLLISIEYTCSNFDDANWWQQTVVSCIKTGLGWWNGLALVQQWPCYLQGLGFEFHLWSVEFLPVKRCLHWTIGSQCQHLCYSLII